MLYSELSKKQGYVMETPTNKLREKSERLHWELLEPGRLLLEALDEIDRLQRGVDVANMYTDVVYCEEHNDWRIAGLICGCGGKHHG